MHLDKLAFADDHGCADREVEGEPRLHTRGVLARIDAVEDILVQLSSEITSEAMELLLSLFDHKVETAILPHALGGSLGQGLEFLSIGVGQMAEGKDVLALKAARVGGTVDLHDVRKLIRMLLLLGTDTAGHTLVGIGPDLVPEDLTAQRHQMVSVSPWDVDAIWFEVFFSWNQTLR